MKKLMMFVAAVVCAMNANADPITGSISFSGSVKFDTGNPATANAITLWSNTKVEDVDGTLGTFLASGNPVTFTAPYVFDPSTPLTLWTAGGFSFNLTSSTMQAQFSVGSLQYLNISGTGTVSGNGYSDTPATWSFSAQSPSVSGKFSFSASLTDPPGVPDSGSTLVLLGLALGGLRLVRLKMAV